MVQSSLHPHRDLLEANLAAAADAMHAAGSSGPEREGYYALQKQWKARPWGRLAEPGDLMGWWLPGEYPHGGDIQCRRCGAVSSLDGHPYGCPRTPRTLDEPDLPALRPCYCGQALVVTPDIFGPCCQDTPPVRVPGGCRWCGSDLRRAGDPDDLPEKDRYVPGRFPEMDDAWVHPRCVDESLLAKAAMYRHAGPPLDVERRRRRRNLPLGVFNP